MSVEQEIIIEPSNPVVEMVPRWLHGWSTEMKCPTCGENTPDNWKFFMPESMREVPASRGSVVLQPARGKSGYTVSYMECANAKCEQMVITLTETHADEMRFNADTGAPVPVKTASSTWMVFPRHTGARLLDPLVGEPYRRDYFEAAAILEASPRMSAVLSRRILADLLEQYAGLSDYRLSARVDEFIKDSNRPTGIRDVLHVLRSMGDFGAHTKRDKSDQDAIIDVSREEAEWTLHILDRLFDYFIVTPTRDAEMKAEMNRKRQAAGQDPIPDLPDQGAS